jgi:hypothetical protein
MCIVRKVLVKLNYVNNHNFSWDFFKHWEPTLLNSIISQQYKVGSFRESYLCLYQKILKIWVVDNS